MLKGWSPFLLASVFIFLAAQPAVARHLTFAVLKQPMPGLHQAVLRVPPVVAAPTPEDAIADLNLLALPGTAVFAGGVLAALWLGLSPVRIVRIFGRTVVRMAPSLLAISFMVGLAFVTRYSGMDTVLGLSLTHTGAAFPFFGTLLGWLGVALTGTDAGSNALFGNLQKVTAERLGLSPVLDGRGELERRRDGQDDRRPVDRRRGRGHSAGRPRGGDLPGRHQAQPGPRRARRDDRHGLRLPAAGLGARRFACPEHGLRNTSEIDRDDLVSEDRRNLRRSDDLPPDPRKVLIGHQQLHLASPRSRWRDRTTTS